MKKLLALLVTACVSVSLFAADVFTFTSLKGSVKNYTQTEYSVATKFGNYFRTPTGKVIHTYNGVGREVESTNLSPRDAVLDKIAYTYDNYGLVTEENCFDVDGNLVWKNSIAYKNGKKESCSEFNNKGTLKAKIIYSYDGDKLVDETGYNGDGALAWKTIYAYDETGRLSKISQYCADGSLDEEETYTYADTGAIESITKYDSFTETKSQSVLRYTNDNLTEITTYNDNAEVVKRVIYKNDNYGNPVKISEYNIAKKFGTTVNELYAITEIVYNY